MTKHTLIGLTGPTGCGKSVVADAWRACGAEIISADECARAVVAPDHPCLSVLVETFTDAILHSDGTLNRAALAAIAFADPAKTQALNAITHPAICRMMKEQADALFAAGCKVVVLDSPQLYEAGQDAICDVVVAVLADKDIRLQRIMARDGIDATAALLRIGAQPTDEFYRERADVVWENNGTPDALQETAKEWLTCL